MVYLSCAELNESIKYGRIQSTKESLQNDKFLHVN
jgi:hypothetical protein